MKEKPVIWLTSILWFAWLSPLVLTGRRLQSYEHCGRQMQIPEEEQQRFMEEAIRVDPFDGALFASMQRSSFSINLCK